MTLTRISGPNVEPITLAEARLHLRIDEGMTLDDTLIQTLISAARQHAERITNRALMSQKWRVTLDCFPCRDTIDLGLPDVVSVDVCTFVASDGTVTPFTGFTLDADAFPSRVVRNYGISWPATRQQRNAVVIAFTVGSDNANALPDLIVGMKLLIGQWYAQREALIESRYALEVPFSVSALFAPHRRPAMEMA